MLKDLLGDVLAYDLDREAMAPFRITSFWKEQNPKARITPVISLSFHPRDIGTLLIGYAEGAVIYSFKQNKPTRFFQYEVPRGAPGGDSDPTAMNVIRHPRLTQAVWHPTGTFILTGHEDGSLVFWDHQKDGRIVMARTLTETNVDKPGSAAIHPAGDTFAVKAPIFKIVWCANVDPDDTGILIAGGASTTSLANGLTFFELGRTPVYQTSSWQVLGHHFGSPKRQRVLPTPPSAEVVDFCLIPRTSPHYNAAQDPIALLAVLSSGELVSMSFPSGYPITPTNQLHISLTFVHPFVTAIGLSPIERSKWLGMTENRKQGPLILQGGAEASRPLKRFESRNIVQTAHADGTVRLWDAGHADEIENEALLQVDVARAAGRDVQITQMSLSGVSGEFAAGTRTGEVAIFRWGHNRNAGSEPPEGEPNKSGGLANIATRTNPDLVDGLLPFTLLDMQNSSITALKLSDVGFFAAGSEGGNVSIVDLRGPAIIYSGNVRDFIKAEKRRSFRSPTSPTSPGSEYPCSMEFSVMTLDGEGYSSILLHVGTNQGRLATFKLLPEASGRYSVQFVGAITLEDKVIRIAPLSAASGLPAYASQQAVAGLRNGSKVDGVLLVVTESGARIFKPATNKGAHKSWDSILCHSACVTRFEDKGYALVGLFGDGTARAFSIPALREIGQARLSDTLDVRRFSETVVTSSGDVFGWTGPSETALLNVWGAGLVVNRSKDLLFNPEALIPPRPTISNLQWVSGIQYVTPADMDILIGGPDRPPSKRMVAQARADEAAARQAGRAGATGGAGAAGGQEEGYWAYMTRQINERTEKLGIMSENVNKLEESSSGWADDVGKFVNQQKKNLVMGGKLFDSLGCHSILWSMLANCRAAVKSKFGF
jgi:syntaxin-binding protein 5